MHDFFETLSDYLGSVALLCAHFDRSGTIEYVAIALEHISVLVRVRDENHSFVSFLKTLSRKSGLFFLGTSDPECIEKHFDVKLSDDKEEAHIKMKDFILKNHYVNAMYTFLRQQNR